MESILKRIVAAKKEEMIRAKAGKPYGEILREAEGCTRTSISFKAALRNSTTGVIAEFKRKSPSKGFIREGARVRDIVPGYEAAGASAISVLTDSEFFGGSLDDLIETRRLVRIPVLRKDFIIDAYQVCEAKLAGADAVLLIASALTQEQCRELSSFADHLGLEVLLEIHCADELAYVHEQVDVVGVNNRNLNTFAVDIQTSLTLSAQIPDAFVKISESGISSPATVKTLQQSGFSGFLMGENFMKQPHPAEALQQFLNALHP
ncbi:MAG: indole-3-glycerol phosphate synthase TrpC [Bacteroidales bacterium]|jgi:indole-3-glycerol phosphate synthase|nr:indole-3-glycerol phosphate synthase TrpC [Bacteroidales bacterium]